MRSLISLLKRERISPKFFLQETENEIVKIKNDESNISTRGESKGELKKEALAKLESLERTLEMAKFFELYEECKKEKNLFDYDDVLENLVKIFENSTDAAADMREKYLYVLVDEHQDSSLVQNEFLKIVWGEEETPEIFVVGDDRQLIYGFSGASIDYFQGFQSTWNRARLISLVENYRSTQIILDTSHELLQSVMTPEKLRSQKKENHPIKLIEANNSKQEILACISDIKEKLKNNLNLEDCAILVPKNKEVREALNILSKEGLAVSIGQEESSLFDQELTSEFIRILKTITRPKDSASFARSFLDSLSGVPVFEAHQFLAREKMREFYLDNFSVAKQSLFGESKVESWLGKLLKWTKWVTKEKAEIVLEKIVAELEIDKNSHLVSLKDILTTILNLFNKEKEKKPQITLYEFVNFLEKLESYNEEVPLIVEEKEGIKVLTLHSSKGLEFDYVWIAHLDEKGLDSGKRLSFSLPESIEERLIESDLDKIKRKLYVAITRAKRFCTLSYSLGEKENKKLSPVISDLPENILQKEFFAHNDEEGKKNTPLLKNIEDLVKNKYTEKVISASALNNFFECPWKWYFRNFLGLPEGENENLIFGSRVHKAINQILSGAQLGETEDLEVRKLVEVWIKTRLPEISKNRQSEQPVSVRDPKFNLNIFGQIDLIEKLEDGSLRITDFKTGHPKKKSEVAKISEEGRLSNMARQLALYSYLIEHSPKWRGAKVSSNRLEFLEAKNSKDKVYEHVRNENEGKMLIKDMEDFEYSLQTGEWTNLPCHYNSYGKNNSSAGGCEYCKLAQVYRT
jgi:DNA helicase-2/ATP-dependent DNA helicase PcrA